jgi:hypothetical protein
MTDEFVLVGDCVPGIRWDATYATWAERSTNGYVAARWHYTLKDEPYPGTYFDFPIG